MAARVVRNSFEKFQKARLAYVTDIADMASKPHYLESLLEEGAVTELKKLLHDRVSGGLAQAGPAGRALAPAHSQHRLNTPTISTPPSQLPTVQQLAAMALGRLASYSTELATELVTSDVLSELTTSMAREGVAPAHLKAGAFVIRAVAKHSEELGQCCVEAGAAPVLVLALTHLDSAVREAAALSLGVLASHSPATATQVVQADALPSLVVSAREPQPALVRACVAALGDIAKHTPELAEAVTEAGVLSTLAALLSSTDAKVKRQTSNCLAQVIKHSLPLAEQAVESGIFPDLLHLTQDADVYVRKNAVAAVREVVKHSEELAALVVRATGLGFLVDYMGDCHGNARLPAIMALGFVASYSETLAMAVMHSGGVPVLKDALVTEPEDHIKAAAVWALGQCGKHGVEHAQVLAEADVLRHLMAAMLHEEASDDLRDKAQRALRVTLTHCRHLAAMQPLLPIAPTRTLKLLLARFVEVLPEDQAQRRALVASGGLKLIQSLDTADAGVSELVDAVNDNFPPEVVEYCSPSFAVTLAERVEAEARQGISALRASGGQGGLSESKA